MEAPSADTCNKNVLFAPPAVEMVATVPPTEAAERIHPGLLMLADHPKLHIQFRGWMYESSKCHCWGCTAAWLAEWVLKPPVPTQHHHPYSVPKHAVFEAVPPLLIAQDTRSGCLCCMPTCGRVCCFRSLHVAFKLDRNFACPLECCPCWPLSCTILMPLVVTIRDADGTVLGRAKQASRMCSCARWIDIHGADGQLIYSLIEPACQKGCFSCCLPEVEGCRPNIQRLVLADGVTQAGEVVFAGAECCRQLCTDAKNAFVTFPEGAPLAHNALVLGATFLAMYFYLGATA